MRGQLEKDSLLVKLDCIKGKSIHVDVVVLGLASSPRVWRWEAEGAAPNRRIGSTKGSFFSQSLRYSALNFIPPLEPFSQLAIGMEIRIRSTFYTQAIESTSQILN